MLEIVFLCTLNMLNFIRLALIATEMRPQHSGRAGDLHAGVRRFESHQRRPS